MMSGEIFSNHVSALSREYRLGTEVSEVCYILPKIRSITQLTLVAEVQSEVHTSEPCRCLTTCWISGSWTCLGLGTVISCSPLLVWSIIGLYTSVRDKKVF